MNARSAAGEPRATRSSAAYVAGSLLVLLAIGLHWAQPPTVVAQVDLTPPFGTEEMLRKCAFAWGDVHSYYGSIDNCSSWYPYSLVLLAFDAIAGPSFGQALVFVATVIVSWLGAFALARALGASPVASFLAAWLYAFNPARQLMVGEFATAEVCAALLPWIGYWLVVAAREPARRLHATAVLGTIAFAPLSVLAATPQLLVASVVGAIAIAAIALTLFAPDRRAYARWLLGAIVVGLAASLWWTVPNAASYAGTAITHPVALSSVAWTFARASLLDEIRFCASWVWQYAEYNPWSIEFDQNVVLYASGFVAALWLVIAATVCRGQAIRAVRAFGALALVMLFIAKGLHPPLAAANVAFYSLPGMFLFIEPDGPVLIAALSLAVCAALGCDGLLRSYAIARVRFGTGAVALSIVAVFLNQTPAVTGAIFHERMDIEPGEHIALPREWVDAAAYLNASPLPGGVVVLPPDDHYQADYSWGYRGIDLLAIELVDRDVLMPGAPWWYTQLPQAASLNAVVDRLVSQRSPVARQVLLDLGIRYAIVRDDVHPVADGLAPLPREDVAMFGAPVMTFGVVEVYDLGDPAPQLAQVPGAAASDEDAGDVELLRAVRLPDATPRAAAAQRFLDNVRPAVTTAVVSATQFRPLDVSRFVAVPRLVGESPDGPTTMTYDVMDPGGSGIREDLLIGEWPRASTTYALTVNGSSAGTTTLAAAPSAQWVPFRDVVLRAGLNHIVVRTAPTVVNTYAAFLTPRLDPQRTWQPQVGAIFFAGLGSPVAKRVIARGASMRVPVLDDPQLTVVSSSAGPTATIRMDVDVAAGAATFECYDEFAAGVPKSLAASVRDCLAALTNETADPKRAVIEALVPYARRDADLRLQVSYVPAIPARDAAIGGDRAADQPFSLGDAGGLGTSVRVSSDDASPLVLAQMYSPTWLAFDVTHSRLLPHWRAFGWSNGWTVAPGSAILVVDWLSVLTLVLLAADAIALVVIWRRR